VESIDNISIKITDTILEALKIIDKSSKQICLVLDENKTLIGTISDGDIRRGILNNVSLNSTVDEVLFKSPIVAHIDDTRETILNIFNTQKIHQIPIIDSNNVVVGIEILDEIILKPKQNNKVVLMVGGLGTRLRPLTEKIPKPMLAVGGKPILQSIIESFVSHGFTNIVMCVGYKSSVIENYFGDGNKFGAKISYVHEKKRMGTAGSLSLLKNTKMPKLPFFVMNGDILTNINFNHFLDYHEASNSKMTMCVKEYDFQVPYGVLNIKDGKIQNIIEKPVHNFHVNAGIYLLEPEILDLIPDDKFYDMNDLFKNILDKFSIGSVMSFPMREYWMDIGKIDEYKRAELDYDKIFLLKNSNEK
jgi:dTDP-glucose pyrophosphorylase/predicted transcriptional regulator